MDYVCHGIVRSENAINRLSRNVAKLGKCTNRLGTSAICLGVAGLLLTAVVSAQDREIKALKKQVAKLAKDMEEQNQQEGV
jgi:hypothetical protein